MATILYNEWRIVGSVFVCLFVFGTVYSQAPPIKHSYSRTAVMERLMKKSDEFRSPPNYDLSDSTVAIECDLMVNSLDSINEAEMDFTVELVIHLQWHDHRLLQTNYQYDFDYLDFDSQTMQTVWVPDIYFPNEKKASFHKIMMSNRNLRLYRDNTVSYNARVSVTLSCRMDLKKYPFDRQVCSILMESFGYRSNKLVLNWMTEDNPVVTNNIKELPQFKLVNSSYSNYTRTHAITGNHSCLQADFVLVRNIGYFVIQMYIPSLLIVMLSWLSFWLNVNSVPGRVTLGVLSVLTISTQSSGVNASLPRVSYTKAIDIWMATCLVFVFASLFEFALVNVLSRKIPGRRFSLARLFLVQKEGQDDLASVRDSVIDHDGHVSIDHRQMPKSKFVVCSEYLDVASRIMFPVAFGIFNMIYWIYYLNVGDY